MSLDTVQNYVDGARVLLQDNVAPYRYSDSELVESLNYSTGEIARLRPDLVFKALRTGTFTAYSAGSMGTAVVLDMRYRLSVLMFIVGYAQLRDQEEGLDERAATFMNKFVTTLSAGVA